MGDAGGERRAAAGRRGRRRRARCGPLAVGPVPGRLLTGSQGLVPALPASRGPLTAVLLHELREPAHRLPPIVLPDTTEPLADEDLQLALYVLYELHYRGFDGVDERWEWEPSALAVRSVLEDIFEGGLLTAIGPPDDDLVLAPEDMDMALRGVADAEDAPSLSAYLEREGT